MHPAPKARYKRLFLAARGVRALCWRLSSNDSILRHARSFYDLQIID
jgi:hypothetical protein